MKVGSKWFIAGVGLFLFLCTGAIVPAKSDTLRVRQLTDNGAHPRQPHQTTLQEGTTTTPQRLQGGPETTAEDADATEGQDPLDPIEPRLDNRRQTVDSVRGPRAVRISLYGCMSAGLSGSLMVVCGYRTFE